MTLKPIITVCEKVTIFRTYDVDSFSIQSAATDRMLCDRCQEEMGEKNPKGFFRANNRWYNLRNNYCVEQGFIIDS